MTVLKQIHFDEVIANPTGLIWESDPMPAGKRILVREFGCSVSNGTVIFSLGTEAIRVITEGTYESRLPREFLGNGQKFKIQRINNSGTPRVISAWIDVLIGD
jgi:hypothetical protein